MSKANLPQQLPGIAYRITHPLIGEEVFISAKEAREHAVKVALIEAEEFFSSRIYYRASCTMAEIFDCIEEV